MNKKRLLQLSDLYRQMDKINDVLQELTSDEESAYDNMPESIQQSEKGDVMQEGIDNLNEAVDYLSDAIGALDFFEIVDVKEKIKA